MKIGKLKVEFSKEYSEHINWHTWTFYIQFYRLYLSVILNKDNRDRNLSDLPRVFFDIGFTLYSFERIYKTLTIWRYILEINLGIVRKSFSHKGSGKVIE